jgi:hypothetical protein
VIEGAMTSDDEVLRVLRQAIERVGIDNLARRPGLARNVLGDVLADDPLAVSLLSGAAEQGALDRLRDQSGDDLAIVAPRLAEGLAASRGLVPEQARWAVDTWSAALGLSVQPPDESPRAGLTEPPPTEPVEVADGSVPEATTRRPGEAAASDGTRAPAAGVPGALPGEELTKTGTRPPVRPRARSIRAAAARAATTKAPESRRESPPGSPEERRGPAGRRGLLVLAVIAGVVVIGGAALLLSLTLSPGRAAAEAWSRTAVVQPKGDGVVATVAHDMSEPLGSKRVRLRSGDQVQVNKGPVEIRLGASAIRLDSGTSVTYTAGTATLKPLLTMTAGQVWVTAAPGQHLGLRSPSSEHADISSGRFVATCANSCTYETLDEPEIVHTGGFQYTMRPHQRFIPSTASTEPMNSQMGASSSASPTTGATDGMGMSKNAKPDPNAPKPEFIASDILRNTPWIRANVARDKQEHRRYATIGGRQLLGAWTVMMQRPDVAADVHRVVTFTLAHCDVATCALGATSTYTDPSGAAKTVRGWVEVDDASGNDVKLTYDRTPAACGSAGKADGTEAVIDRFAFSGTAGDGTRVTTYTPGPSSSCTSASTREVAAATIAVVGHRDITRTDAPFTSPGPVQSLVLQHVHGAPGTCSPGSQRQPGESADATCTPPSASSGGPKTIAYYSFPTTAALNAAYAVQVRNSKQRSDSGNCNEGLCERSVSDGRRLIYGDAFLVETDQRSRMMIIATGSVRSQLAHWRADQHDFSFAPLPVRGL